MGNVMLIPARRLFGVGAGDTVISIDSGKFPIRTFLNVFCVVLDLISRFARNTLDCLKYIRQLKDMNIPVLFEKESINTMDAKGEVLITIMASLAQQESQSVEPSEHFTAFSADDDL